MDSSTDQENALYSGLCSVQATGVTCLQEELMPNYIQAFSLNKDIILTGDLNCDLLCVNPRGKALRSLCSSLNATKLIDKPKRVTQFKCSLLDVVIISNPNLVHSSGVQELTISDHFLVFVAVNLKVPKPSQKFIVTHSFRKYESEQFADDIAHIPWDAVQFS